MEGSMERYKIAFTGHRNKVCDARQLDNIMRAWPNAIWVHGGAAGFDTQVAEFARAHGITEQAILPDYDNYTGHVAPLKRNDQIVDGAHILVACYDGRKGGGTHYTVNKAQKVGIAIHYLEAREVPFGRMQYA
jgi:hypothetical protein